MPDKSASGGPFFSYEQHKTELVENEGCRCCRVSKLGKVSRIWKQKSESGWQFNFNFLAWLMLEAGHEDSCQ
jgi:hypothetical protein